MVEAGNFRFSILTARLIRIEYAEDAVFEDRPTLDVSNRGFEAVPFDHSHLDGELVVDTGAVRLVCRDTHNAPTPMTLSATITTADGTTTWSFGDDPVDNLGGTVRTLDMWRGDSIQRVTGYDASSGFIREWDPQRLGDGFLSRARWATFDDSNTVVLDEVAVPVADGGSTRRPWPLPRREAHRVDLYLFGYGSDHDDALRAANILVGPQPLPPRWAFGYWYSRYYPYTDTDLVDLVDELDHNGIPTDVLVIDMDWHRPGWTGYSWDPDLYTDPTATLAELRRRGLRVAMNLHPADGVGDHEDAFEQMCAALGLDPAQTGRIPFDPTDPVFVDAYFRILHHPEEDRGVDFWWLDWQQGTDSAMEGLDPLAWLNRIHWEDQHRQPDRRPLNFSRWDGVGAARRPIGFSGDTFATWESLAYQPHFTATAANVLFGYWSHDIGGHFGGSGDAELYLRWIQFGAHSPILRTHGSLDMVEERRIWEYPNRYRRAMVAAVRRRYELIPYIYSCCALGTPRGRSLVRPMYHDHPGTDAAYQTRGQYMFGDDMIVAPITEPSDEDGLAPVSVWLPEGAWYDTAAGVLITVDEPGGHWSTRRCLLDEIPVFVRAGAVIATQRGVRRNNTPCYPNLWFEAYPGGDTRTILYEDDGTTPGYEHGEKVLVAVEHRCDSVDRSISIGASSGDYTGWQPVRHVTVGFHGSRPPESVVVDGHRIEWSRRPSPGRWSYDTAAASVTVDLGEVDLRTTTNVVIRSTRSSPVTGRAMGTPTGAPTAGSQPGPRPDVISGLVGVIHRLESIDRDVRVLMGDDSRLLARLARVAARIDADPTIVDDELAMIPEGLRRLETALIRATEHWKQGESLEPLSPPRASNALRRALDQLVVTVDDLG